MCFNHYQVCDGLALTPNRGKWKKEYSQKFVISFSIDVKSGRNTQINLICWDFPYFQVITEAAGENELDLLYI